MRRALREYIEALHQGRCGYCGVSETGTGAALTVDHFRPRSQGGDDEEDNLVLRCHACDEFKGDYWPSQTELMLIHPRKEEPSQFLREGEDGVLVALHPRGEVQIARLHLNRAPAVARRAQDRKQARLLEAHEKALATIQAAEERTRVLEDALRRARST